MAEVVAPGSQGNTQHAQAAHRVPHGKKRAADSSLESEQRLSKRFDLLNLAGNDGARLYIPVAGSSDAVPKLAKQMPKPVAPVTEKKRERKPRPPPADDCMQVEDTPHRVYIHDLAAELSDIESDEDNPIFLLDIEKHLAKIPKHVLRGPEPEATKENQLVLYNVPSSLTVPEEQDSVRKAIVEARARARARQVNPTIEFAHVNRIDGIMADRAARDIPVPAEDPDAMDID